MSRKIKIWDDKNGDVIYEGNDRRPPEQYFWKFFSLKDLAVIVSQTCALIIGMTIFQVNNQNRVNLLESNQAALTENQTKLRKNQDELIKCQTQADNFHASIFGTQFDCGRPVGNPKTKAIKDANDG